MKNLKEQLPNNIKQVKNIHDLSLLETKDQKDIISYYYESQLYSWKELADFLGTYPNKLMRLAKKLGIKFRDKSKAQKIALIKGRKIHPTKDTHRPESTKTILSQKSAESWANMTEEEKIRRRDIAKKLWKEKSEVDKIIMRERGSKAIRKAALEGSALEFFLRENLTKLGFEVDFHKEQWALREKLQIDLFIRNLNVAIEIDGPTHFDDIYGADRLAKVQQRDLEKDSLLVRNGFIIIRIRHRKCESVSCKNNILEILVEKLNQIKLNYPPIENRKIIIDATRDK